METYFAFDFHAAKQLNDDMDQFHLTLFRIESRGDLSYLKYLRELAAVKHSGLHLQESARQWRDFLDV